MSNFVCLYLSIPEKMDSDDDYLYEATDSGNESPEGEDSEDQVGKRHILLFRKL